MQDPVRRLTLGRLIKPPKSPPAVLYPRNVERRYEVIVGNLVAGFQQDLHKEVVEVLPMLEAIFRSEMGATRRLDSDRARVRLDIGDAFDLLEAALARVMVNFGRAVTTRRRDIQDVGQEVNKDSAQSAGKRLGVDLVTSDPQVDRAVEVWTKDNSKKITAIGQQQADRISSIVLNGYRQGIAPSALRSAVLDTFRPADARDTDKATGMSFEDRAKFIARNEVSTLTGQVNQLRQTRMGLDKYIWQTSEDERVRPSHAALNGKVMRWDSPPPFGHPGMDFNCRCIALPYLDDSDTDDE